MKPKRNAPCPCGSGKKWKKCCGGVRAHPEPRHPTLRRATMLDTHDLPPPPPPITLDEFLGKFDPEVVAEARRLAAKYREISREHHQPLVCPREHFNEDEPCWGAVIADEFGHWACQGHQDPNLYHVEPNIYVTQEDDHD